MLKSILLSIFLNVVKYLGATFFQMLAHFRECNGHVTSHAVFILFTPVNTLIQNNICLHWSNVNSTSAEATNLISAATSVGYNI